MSADQELGLVYLPVESATGDRYGGDRPGNNLFSSSTVALDYKTGERRWHFQSTHHDVWDWDTPSAPILADLPDGRKALIQTLKQSHLFTFDRATGEPLFPIEERPVPGTDVAGEWTALTQPFPVLPLPYDRQGFEEEDLVDFTPEILAKAKEAAKPFRFSTSVFTPPRCSRTRPMALRARCTCPRPPGARTGKARPTTPRPACCTCPRAPPPACCHW
jgi:quinoprotein glucose dehydrogenase